jgi:hypothetical protein
MFRYANENYWRVGNMNPKIRKLAALTMVLGGCSFGMKGVDPQWDGKQEPVCADSSTPVIMDGLAAVALSSGFKYAVQSGLYTPDTPVTAGVIATSLLYSLGAWVGRSRYKECRLVKADWHVREAIRESSAHADLALNSVAAPGSPGAPSPPLASSTPAALATTAAARGYFCTSSLSRSESTTCMRERAACERAQKILTAPEGDACAPHQVAWCFDLDGDPQCFATRRACEVQIATDGVASRTCTERS